jgi:hypothetical protein
MGGLFPTDLGTQTALIEGMNSLQHQTGLFALLALVGFLWTGSGLFGAMEEAFSVVFQTPTRPFLRQKLMAVAMMGLFAVLALLAVGTSALSLTKGDTGYVVQVAIGVVSGFVLFFAIYTVVPNRRQRLSRVLPGPSTEAPPSPRGHHCQAPPLRRHCSSWKRTGSSQPHRLAHRQNQRYPPRPESERRKAAGSPQRPQLCGSANSFACSWSSNLEAK